MDEQERGQVSRSAAEVYEQFFVPALFAEWTGRVADAARVGPGDRVLDVACGTGVLARDVARRVAPGGAAVGLDVNEGMLAVAGRAAPDVEWHQGAAEQLPFEDAAFDAVVSQFGLMFFQDRGAALGEMRRVLRPGGRLAVAVWASLDVTPGYAAMVDLLRRLFGEPPAEALRAPYVLGDVDRLGGLFAAAGFAGVEIRTHEGTARFPSIAEWVHTDVKGWTLADMLDDEQFAVLKREAETALRRFVVADGSVAFPAPAHIVTAG